MAVGRWVGGKYAFVSPAKADALAANTARPGDLVFTQRGTLGQVAVVPKGRYDKYIISQSQMKLTVDESRASSAFLYYVFTTAEQQEYVRQNAIQTGVPHTNLGLLRNTRICLPPLPEQKAIASILGALDDKIELNARMNRTLEAMARAIFKSWFVDFAPVRAKMEGRKPSSMDDATAALFPDSFEDSELGRIPKGWSSGSIGDLVSLERRSLNPMAFPDEQFEHYSIPAYDGGEMPVIEAGEVIRSNKSLVPPNCVLLSKLNPRFPRVWMAAVGRARRSICSTEFLVALPKPASSREFAYGLFSSRDFQAAFATLVTGTSSSHQRVTPESLLTLPAIIPTPDVLRAFTESVTSVHSKIASGIRESRTLAQIRDALLPKLVSGKIRVRDAERIVEAGA